MKDTIAKTLILNYIKDIYPFEDKLHEVGSFAFLYAPSGECEKGQVFSLKGGIIAYESHYNREFSHAKANFFHPKEKGLRKMARALDISLEDLEEYDIQDGVEVLKTTTTLT